MIKFYSISLSLSFSLLISTLSTNHAVTSVHKMLILYEVEGNLVKSARHWLTIIPNRFQLTKFHKFVNNTLQERRSQNFRSGLLPVVQYRLLRRFTHKWPVWRRRICRFNHPKVRSFLHDYQRISSQYDHVDVLHSQSSLYITNAFILLELTYGHEAKLATRTDQVTNTRLTLTPCESIELAVKSLDRRLDAWSSIVTPLWIDRAITNLRLRFPYWNDKSRLNRILQSCRSTLSEESGASSKVFNTLRNMTEDLQNRLDLYEEFANFVRSDSDIEACRTKEFMEFPLYCFYFSGLLGPYAPFKYELRHQFVAVIHDLLPTTVTSEIIKIAAPTMTVSSVLEKGSSIAVLTARLSESGHIEKAMDLRKWLDKRIHFATLLQTDVNFSGGGSEVPSVINYGIGGFYESHYDYLYFDDDKNDLAHSQSSDGDRLATVMIYLTGSLLGGHTAFTNLNISVKPAVGKAVFWFNLDPSTRAPLNDSLHCACSVAAGSKWIVTKWIREYNNFGKIMPSTWNSRQQDTCKIFR